MRLWILKRSLCHSYPFLVNILNQNKMRLFLTQLLFFILFSLQISAGERGLKSFSFIQLADTQLGFGGYMHDMQSFEQAVEQINELNPDFVVICGDLVNVPCDSSYADFNRIKARLKVPCYCTPGNHDMQKLPGDTSFFTTYRKVIGKDYYSFKHKGCSFIVANTQLWKTDIKGESEKYDRWFVETIKTLRSGRHPLFVIGHIPLYVSEPEEKKAYFNVDPAKRKEILDLFTESNVVAYLSGHTHKLVCNEYNGMQLVSCETTSENFDKRPFGFRLWKVSSDSISHHFIPLKNRN